MGSPNKPLSSGGAQTRHMAALTRLNLPPGASFLVQDSLLTSGVPRQSGSHGAVTFRAAAPSSFLDGGF